MAHYVVHKHVLKKIGNTDIIIKTGSEVLNAIEQRGDIVLYVKQRVGVSAERKLKVLVVPTGEKFIINDKDWEYANTVVLPMGLVYHVFYRISHENWSGGR